MLIGRVNRVGVLGCVNRLCREDKVRVFHHLCHLVRGHTEICVEKVY